MMRGWKKEGVGGVIISLSCINHSIIHHEQYQQQQQNPPPTQNRNHNSSPTPHPPTPIQNGRLDIDGRRVEGRG